MQIQKFVCTDLKFELIVGVGNKMNTFGSNYSHLCVCDASVCVCVRMFCVVVCVGCLGALSLSLSLWQKKLHECQTDHLF